MKNLLTVCSAFIMLNIIVGCVSTEDAEARLRGRIAPAYIKYVKDDISLSKAVKTEKIDAVKFYSYKEMCYRILPEYIGYVQNDPNISEAKKKAIITNARSYIYVDQHFSGRVK